MRSEASYQDMSHFDTLRAETHCPFAGKSNAIEVAENGGSIESVCQRLSVLLPQAIDSELDIVHAGIPPEYTTDAQGVGLALKQILLNLDENCLDGVESPDWRLRLYDHKFFVATFWQGFEESSPRKCTEGGLLLFQPKSSFVRRGLTGGETEDRMRGKIRTIFARNGQSYDHGPMTEAERFLPGVDWWK